MWSLQIRQISEIDRFRHADIVKFPVGWKRTGYQPIFRSDSFWETKMYRKKRTNLPTVHFTILVLQNLSIDDSEQHRVSLFSDVDASKLWTSVRLSIAVLVFVRTSKKNILNWDFLFQEYKDSISLNCSENKQQIYEVLLALWHHLWMENVYLTK